MLIAELVLLGRADLDEAARRERYEWGITCNQRK
ncbi:hypothetical protein JOM49_008517 [Amycolatopsis magusensis]|uniref:Uncharacterized protein n=1 Tax=Amycolatopsis magusensis TaxID=882444 RepID=A0ABS4Q5N0_9PSEU|nr:hypothetical protein [Amycolatopsis magusensis]